MTVRKHPVGYSAQLGDNRALETIIAAEATLALPDPIDGLTVSDRLRALVHPELYHLVFENIPRWLNGALGPARHGGQLIQVPEVHELTALIHACRSGHNGDRDNSPAWRSGGMFGSRGDQAQNLLRSIWQGVKALQTPPASQHDELAGLLAEYLRDLFRANADAQQAALARKAERTSPKARSQAAAAALAALDQFMPAFVGWTNAARDAGGAPFPELGQQLPRLRGRLEQELSR